MRKIKNLLLLTSLILFSSNLKANALEDLACSLDSYAASLLELHENFSEAHVYDSIIMYAYESKAKQESDLKKEQDALAPKKEEAGKDITAKRAEDLIVKKEELSQEHTRLVAAKKAEISPLEEEKTKRKEYDSLENKRRILVAQKESAQREIELLNKKEVKTDDARSLETFTKHRDSAEREIRAIDIKIAQLNIDPKRTLAIIEKDLDAKKAELAKLEDPKTLEDKTATLTKRHQDETARLIAAQEKELIDSLRQYTETAKAKIAKYQEVAKHYITVLNDFVDNTIKMKTLITIAIQHEDIKLMLQQISRGMEGADKSRLYDVISSNFKPNNWRKVGTFKYLRSLKTEQDIEIKFTKPNISITDPEFNALVDNLNSDTYNQYIQRKDTSFYFQFLDIYAIDYQHTLR